MNNRRTNVHRVLIATLAVLLAALSASPAGYGKNREPRAQQDSSAQKQTAPSPKKGGATISRIPTGVFEVIKNKVSNVEFYSTNYGIFGLNVAANQAGGLWPRGQNKAYIFGGGIWLGALKRVKGTDSLAKMAVISYNPNSGSSWMVPGRVTEPIVSSVADESAAAISRYRMYFSTDYSGLTGEPIDAADKAASGPNWPNWDTNPFDTLKDAHYPGYVGKYVEDPGLRDRAVYPKGPAIISQEDIFSYFKDTDLNRYEIGKNKALQQGYPLGIQFEQSIYTWGFGHYADFIFIRYLAINKSTDTLFNCYMAPAMDMDIGNAANDHNAIAVVDKTKDSLNLAIQWSESETSGQFGYLGCDFLESPAVDANGFLRRDSSFYSHASQLGLLTFRNWTIDIDPKTPEERYSFMASAKRDVDNGAGDKRFLMATGPFNLLPGDTARVVIGIMFAYGNSTVPTGLGADLNNLITLDQFAQQVYDSNFAAPVAPDPCTVSWKPVNNGVELTWNQASERSVDFRERGLDFAGYKIQRVRKATGTFSTDSTQTWNLSPKTVATFTIPPIPDTASRFRGQLGPWYRLPMLADTGSPAIIGSRDVIRVDTIKRPGLADSTVRVKTGTTAIVKFLFDPYDDFSNQTTHYFTGRYGGKFDNKLIRDIVHDAIADIMDSITSGRRFIDVGDDNADGKILESPTDLRQNEKLINNTDYYYTVLAFDAGSSDDLTPSKFNTGLIGVNQVRATPEAPAAGLPVTPTIVSQKGLGGIYNFRFNVIDNLRLAQLFGGDTLQFEFQPYNSWPIYNPLWYLTQVTVHSKKTGDELMKYVLDYGLDFSDRAFPPAPIGSNLDTLLASRRDPKDTTKLIDKRGARVTVSGTYQPDASRPIEGTVGIYKNTFSTAFDYTFQQFGDSLRFGQFGDTVLPYKQIFNAFEKTSTTSDANLVGFRQYIGQQYASATMSRNADTSSIQVRITSIGQPKLEVEFLPGGTENLTYVKGGKTYTFNNVPYLTMKVRNVASYTRESFDAAGNRVPVDVKYDYTFTADNNAQSHVDFPTTIAEIERLVPPGQFAVYAYGWQDADTLAGAAGFTLRKNAISRSKFLASPKPIGTSNRYYLSGTAGTDGTNPHKLGFTNKLVANGAAILLDFAGMGSTTTAVDTLNLPQSLPTADFKAGDKIVVNFTGGALGLPQPGAMVEVAIPETKVALPGYTDNILDQVTVVPNPYLVSHIGQISNTDHKIYFTQLPEECTIQIYTETGELLQTVQHKASVLNGRIAVDAWDLVTKGNRLSQSQLLVARISTPNGAQTIKKFSIVVGGFRVTQ